MFVLIRNAHVYAPEDLGKQDVLICDRKIVRVAPKIDFPWDGDDLTLLDAEGKSLVPGFIDQHVHIIGGGGEDGFASLIREIQMTDCVRWGVTTVVGVLGTDCNAKHVETLVARTKALREQGMTAYCLTGSYTYPPITLTGSVAKDMAFVDEIIGVKIAIAEHRASNISAEELARLATQVRTVSFLTHKPGVVHMHTGRGKKQYSDVLRIVEETDIPITQFRPTHVNIDSESTLAFARAGGYLDFTSGSQTSESAAQLKKALGLVPLAQITLSSDSNGSFPKWSEDGRRIVAMGVGKMETLFDTIRRLVREQGVDLGTAVSIITRNVADALMIYPTKGCIGKGADADMVLLDDELRITDVLALGKFMVRGGELVAKDYYDYG
ncbi:MAG: beta-aspartyl-peptidase [Oscillospiraceae bacterium]|nr:beta-aspartyl-peptidase [Oscillospiraceae bacterium]